MTQEKLAIYINQSILKGASIETIRKNLRANGGWSNYDIDKTLSDLGLDPIIPINTKKETLVEASEKEEEEVFTPPVLYYTDLPKEKIEEPQPETVDNSPVSREQSLELFATELPAREERTGLESDIETASLSKLSLDSTTEVPLPPSLEKPDLNRSIFKRLESQIVQKLQITQPSIITKVEHINIERWALGLMLTSLGVLGLVLFWTIIK